MKRIKWNSSWQDLAEKLNQEPHMKGGSGASGEYTAEDAQLFMAVINTNEEAQKAFLRQLKLKYN